MSSYCSFGYLAVILPGAILLYALTPQKYRWLTLLLASYAVFFSISGKLIVYLWLTTLSTYGLGRGLAKLQTRRRLLLAKTAKENRKAVKKRYAHYQQILILLTILIAVGLLLVLKYTPFILTNLKLLLPQIQVLKLAVPIGISFYTLQAVSYVIDIYHEKFTAETHLGKFALYMCFFPTIMEGPICRYQQTADQLFSGEAITYHQLTFGLQRIIYGLIKKMVIADRLNLFIKTVYHQYTQYDGGMIALAAIFYTIQLYMEFSGTMDIVIGSAEIFGISLPENFRQPFFSKSISEFWQRWHITLGAWLKDYVFYPISMAKPMKKLTTAARKRLGNHYGPLVAGAIALFAVWFGNGLWHGAGWKYIFFGMYHFSLILLASLFEPLNKKIHSRMPLPGYFAMLKTTILVVIGEMFFRAPGLKAGLTMFKIMVTQFSLESLTNGTLFTLGIDAYDLLIVLISLLLLGWISHLKEKGINIREEIAQQSLPCRWLVYYGLILFLIIFGAYGSGYVPIDPIYANF